MKRVMALVLIATGFCTCRAATAATLVAQGTICRVVVSEETVTISFKGIGQLHPDDPAFTNRKQPLALYDTSIELKFNGGVGNYSRFRYLEDDLDREEAIELLQQFRDDGTEMEIRIAADRIIYSMPQGRLRVSRISGTLGALSPWASLFRESIAERLNDLGVDYNVVMGVEHDLDEESE